MRTCRCPELATLAKRRAVCAPSALPATNREAFPAATLRLRPPASVRRVGQKSAAIDGGHDTSDQSIGHC